MWVRLLFFNWLLQDLLLTKASFLGPSRPSRPRRRPTCRWRRRPSRAGRRAWKPLGRVRPQPRCPGHLKVNSSDKSRFRISYCERRMLDWHQGQFLTGFYARKWLLFLNPYLEVVTLVLRLKKPIYRKLPVESENWQSKKHAPWLRGFSPSPT